jgi:hypothetical protein
VGRGLSDWVVCGEALDPVGERFDAVVGGQRTPVVRCAFKHEAGVVAPALETVELVGKVEDVFVAVPGPPDRTGDAFFPSLHGGRVEVVDLSGEASSVRMSSRVGGRWSEEGPVFVSHAGGGPPDRDLLLDG